MASFDLPGKTILLHNRSGLRIELNFGEVGRLEIWISPLAGRSLAANDRNFSNRDDHTRLFDRILLPGLSEGAFVACDYDAFRTTVRFRKQTLHLLSLFDRPGVALWFEGPQFVDFKSDKADAAVTRNERTFVVAHPDRGYDFHFAAAVDRGAAFIHQPVLDRGRSTFARAVLGNNQRVVIAGGLHDENIAGLAAGILRAAPAKLLAAEQRKVDAAQSPGRLELAGRPKLQRLLDINRRVLISMQDESGAVRAAINRIYYLIWVRDGAMMEVTQGHAGDLDPLVRWCEFLLANPTVVEEAEPRGRTFLMLVNQITKWEEDGIFYAIWSVFNAWTQSGDERWRDPEILRLLAESLDWLERRCFDAKRGLFGRFFRCETPLPGSRDDGFDAAVGMPTGRSDVRFDGVPVRQSFDIYINVFAASAYRMMSALHERGPDYAAKAANVEARLADFIPSRGLPDYGDLLGQDGRTRRAGPYGLDLTDYTWALSVAPFIPQPWRFAAIRQQALREARKKPRGWFLAAYFSLLASMDPDSCDETEILDAIEYAAAQCYRAGKYLAMPNTVVEMLEIEDGDKWHDVRPQAFSIGPWLATMCGLGLRRQPFGLAVRAGWALRKISAYEYRDAKIDVTFAGTGSHVRVALNGRPLEHTLQLPEDRLRPRTLIAVERVRSAVAGPLLVGSSVRLESVDRRGDAVRYVLTAFGANTLEFRQAGAFELTDASGNAIPFTEHPAADRRWIAFSGRGTFHLTVFPS